MFGSGIYRMDDRTLLVGYGRWGKKIAKALKTGLLVCEKDSTKSDEMCPYFDFKSVEKALECESVKRVIVATEPDSHYEIAKAVLESGRNCFVEKPLATSVEQAEELAQIAKERGLKLSVGYITHFDDVIYYMFFDQLSEVMKAKNSIEKIVFRRCLKAKPDREPQSVRDLCYNLLPHDVSLLLELYSYDDLRENFTLDKRFCEERSEYDLTGKERSEYDLTGKERSEYDLTGEEMIFTLSPLDKGTRPVIEIVVSDRSISKDVRINIFTDIANILYDDSRKLHIRRRHTSVGSYTITEDSEYVRRRPKNEDPLTTELVDFCVERRSDRRYTNTAERAVEVAKVIEWFLLEAFIENSSVVDFGAKLGNGCRVWHFCHITKDAIVGAETTIGQNCYIAGEVGKNCKIQNNVSIYKGVKAGDRVFFGPSCVFTNVLRPRVAQPTPEEEYVETLIENDVSIGANATIRCGVVLGEGCFVGAGSVVLEDVAPGETVVGNPAKPI